MTPDPLHNSPNPEPSRQDLDARALSFDAAADAFVRCATEGAADRAERLLALHPGIAGANLHTALVLGDAASVEAQLDLHPEWVTRSGGPQNWEPLLYVCHTCMHGSDPARLAGLTAIARRLCALGANPNAAYHWNWHPELPHTALWASICAVKHLPLAEVLLQAGANPTDGVSMHIAGGGGNLAALDLLQRFAVDVNGIPGGVPPLVYMMLWSDDPAGPRWLLEHGADPNRAWGEAGEAPLHVAARRWAGSMVDLLLQHGADPSLRRADGAAPHTLAELHGNVDAAARLLEHGAGIELALRDRFVAACARGDRAAADAMLAAHPGLPAELQPAHHLLLQRPAESGNTAVLETMLARGFDPFVKDKDGVTALHRAAMAGQADAVRSLLKAGAPVNVLDRMFAATPLLWAVEGWNHVLQADADHVAVARLLIKAGSSLEWAPPDGAPGAAGTLESLAALRRAAAQD